MASTPQKVKFIVARVWSRCFWCGYLIRRGASVVYYSDEDATAHEKCHMEACP